MKFLFNLTAQQAARFDFAKHDRVIGEPQSPHDSHPGAMDYLLSTGQRGLYAKDDSILGAAELYEEAKENYRAFKQHWLVTAMEVAQEALGCVPPVMQRGGSFAMGEPWDHTPKGKPIYLCFRGFDYDSPTCEAQYLTLQEFVRILTTR